MIIGGLSFAQFPDDGTSLRFSRMIARFAMISVDFGRINKHFLVLFRIVQRFYLDCNNVERTFRRFWPMELILAMPEFWDPEQNFPPLWYRCKKPFAFPRKFPEHMFTNTVKSVSSMDLQAMFEPYVVSSVKALQRRSTSDMEIGLRFAIVLYWACSSMCVGWGGEGNYFWTP